jgi:hypothetical protein
MKLLIWVIAVPIGDWHWCRHPACMVGIWAVWEKTKRP